MNDNWSDVPGVEGYLGAGLTAATGADPQTITADGSGSTTDVIANGATTSSSGGVLEAAAEQTIAIQGSGTADAPHVVLPPRTSQTRRPSPSASTPRTSTERPTTRSSRSRSSTASARAVPTPTCPRASSRTRPSERGDQGHPGQRHAARRSRRCGRRLRPGVTTNAAGNDEWVGIDNISSTRATRRRRRSRRPRPATRPGWSASRSRPITLAATGGIAPYTWEATGLPDGLSETEEGAISGTPTTPVARSPWRPRSPTTTAPRTPSPSTYTVTPGARDHADRRDPGHRCALAVRPGQRQRLRHRRS